MIDNFDPLTLPAAARFAQLSGVECAALGNAKKRPLWLRDKEAGWVPWDPSRGCPNGYKQISSDTCAPAGKVFTPQDFYREKVIKAALTGNPAAIAKAEQQIEILRKKAASGLTLADRESAAAALRRMLLTAESGKGRENAPPRRALRGNPARSYNFRRS